MRLSRLAAGALLCAALVLPAGAAAATPNAADLEAELVCPTCKTTLDQSDSPVAQRMKAFIRARIAAGDSGQEIKDRLVAQFGEGVLAKPPSGGFGALAWALPLVAVVVATIAVGLAIRTWSRRRTPPPAIDDSLEPELDRLVDEELARFDA